MNACPQCGHPSSFQIRRRQVDLGVEEFIKCSACPYEVVIRAGPKEIVDLERDIDKLRGKIAAGGSCLAATLARREKRLAELKLVLERDAG